MPNNIDIERFKQFRKDVESLQLRFPITEIAERTEWDKGNVSSYYNGKKAPSKNFLKKFHLSFEKELRTAAPSNPAEILSAIGEDIEERYHVSPATWQRVEDTLSTLQDTVISLKNTIDNNQTATKEIILQTFAVLQKELKTYIRHKIPKKNSGKNEDS